MVVAGPGPASAGQVEAFKTKVSSSGGVRPGDYSDDELTGLLMHGGLATWLLDRRILPAVETFQAPCSDSVGIVPCFFVGQRGYDYPAIFADWFHQEVEPAIIITAIALEFWLAAAYVRAGTGDPGAVEAVSESMSARARLYQQQRTALPQGSAYVVNGVKFDGYANGVLLEAKGEGYAWAVSNGRFQPWFKGADTILAQAQRQLNVSGNVAIRWEVAEAETAAAIQRLFADNGIQGITVVHIPMAP